MTMCKAHTVHNVMTMFKTIVQCCDWMNKYDIVTAQNSMMLHDYVQNEYS